MPHSHSRPKNLLVLTSTFPRWKDDVEPPFVFELCRRLAGDFRVHVLAPHTAGAAATEVMGGLHVYRYRYFFTGLQKLAYQGGILSNLNAKRSRYVLVPFFLLSQLVAAVKLVRTRRFDCIHAHWLIPQGMTAAIAARATSPSPPILTTSHGSDIYGLSGGGFRILKRAVATRSAAITVVSRSMIPALKRLSAPAAGIHVIPMGVDLQKRFTPAKRPKSGQQLLYVGRLTEQKGVHVLIDALPLIAESHPGVSLVIAGEGQEKQNLQKRVLQRKMQGRVAFVGAVNNKSLAGFYRKADVVVFPSVEREGFGLVAVEALGCECATVVTDLPAMADIVTDGETGLVIPQKNTERLAESVSRLLNDPTLRARLGHAGRRHVLERFDWRIVAAQYRQLIQSLTEGSRASFV